MQLAAGSRIWPCWLQGTSTSHSRRHAGQEQTCRQGRLRLATEAGSEILGGGHGEARALPERLRPASSLLGAVTLLALLLVGDDRLSKRARLEEFQISSGAPRGCRTGLVPQVP